MKNLWDSQTIAKVTGGKSSGQWMCSGLSIDTRTLKEGDLFIALQGDTGNGHRHLLDATQKGAVAAIVSESVDDPLPVICVENTLSALEKIGIAARERCLATRIAVTGSVGKTSTKDMLLSVLKNQGLTHGSASSYNNLWGVPLTLGRMPQETQFGVFEIGMNHSGEIRPLTKMVQPHISIITTVVESHIEFFKSVRDIALAKAEIFEGMEKGRSVILNHDNDHFDLLSRMAKDQGLNVYSFGENKNANFHLLSWESEEGNSKVIAEIDGRRIAYTLPLPGHHWVINSLSVLGAVALAGGDIEEASRSLSHIEAPEGRGQWYKGRFTIIDESYNANPTSMRAALNVLGKSSNGRKIAVIGDMRELGDISRKRHEELRDSLLDNKIDLVFCCGPYMSFLYESLPIEMKGAYAPTSLELLPDVLNVVDDGDLISVKASLGTRIKPIVEALLARQQEQQKKRN